MKGEAAGTAFFCAFWLFVLCWAGAVEAQVDIRYATGFEVVDFETHRVVRVKQPWRDARETFEYVLIPRGAKPPEGYRPHQIFEAPVRGFVPLSTSFLPHADVLRIQDDVVALSDFKYVNTPSILARIEAGQVVAVGHGAGLDVETLMSLKPGLVMVNAFGNPQGDPHHRLGALSIPVVVNGEYMETHPLGRAEWLKFTALFFGKEEEAGQIFDEIAQEYERLAELGRSVAHRPRVLTDTSWRGTWHVPGGGSFMAQFLSDAGADYIWKDDVSTGGLPLSFETVLARARDADFWINVGAWRSLAEALAADSRYSAFNAFQTGRVYNRDRRVNPHGGNDFWETAIIQPHKVLADLLKIFHPELLPNHDLVWYRQLDP